VAQAETSSAIAAVDRVLEKNRMTFPLRNALFSDCLVNTLASGIRTAGCSA
jgi:hypothetical protein